jgi:hypothetical protein
MDEKNKTSDFWIDRSHCEPVEQIRLNCNLLFSNEIFEKEIVDKNKKLKEYKMKWIELKKAWELEKLRRHEEINTKNVKFLCDSVHEINIDTIFS